MTERRCLVFLMRMSGMTMAQIAAELGVSAARAGQVAQDVDLRIERAARSAEHLLHPEWSTAAELRVRQRLATWQDLAHVEPRVTWWMPAADRAAWPQLAEPRFSHGRRGRPRKLGA